jgi:hypothetical protein
VNNKPIFGSNAIERVIAGEASIDRLLDHLPICSPTGRELLDVMEQLATDPDAFRGGCRRLQKALETRQ